MSVGKAGILLEIQNGHLGKGKVHTRTGHEGPEGEQRYSCTLSLTSALDGVGSHQNRARRPWGGQKYSCTPSLTSALDGVDGQRRVPAALSLGKTRYPLYRRLGGPQGLSGRVQKISPPPGFDPRTVQPVARSMKASPLPARSVMCVHAYVHNLQSLTSGSLVVWGF